ncbi:cell surface protein SprA [Candidatus Zixiibacteriota bacterium]
MNSTLSGRLFPGLFLLCLLLYTPAGVKAFQEEQPVRARIGVRQYLLVGVYDNMTVPRSPGRAIPGLVPLRDRGLYPPDELPGLRQFVDVLPGHQQIRFQTRAGSIDVQKPTIIGFSEYLDMVRREQARRNLLANFEATQQTEEVRRGLLEFEIPINVPRGLERVVGEGGAGLRVRGTRNLRFSGKSEWTEGAVSTATQYVSKFPSLNMEQESRFEIIGNVGSKVEVSIEQDTRALTDLENNINLVYRGDENEILQELIAGNTNFQLPGTQFVGFNQGASGLFGVKGTARLGPLTFTALATQEKGAGEKATFTAGARESEIRRPDIEPQLGTYYFLDMEYRDRFSGRTYTPADSIVTINVFVDDQQYSNDTQKAAIDSAIAWFDPALPAPLDSREAHLGSFHLLDPGEYYVNRAGGYLALNVSLGPKEVLGVVYTKANGDQIGSMPTPQDPTAPLIMKLIKPPDPRPDDATWKYELRNVYYLGARNIPADGLKVRIFFDPPSGDDQYTRDGEDYLQILGLDQWGERPGTPPDGNIDLNENNLNLARGELIFPDLEPFMNEDLVETVDMYDTISRFELTQRTRYYINVQMATRSVTYSLPATNILERSDVVTINGRRLQRGTDYQINYLTGELTFLTEDIQDPTADVKVDYEYSPIIQLEQKTLVGARAEYQLGQVGMISGMILSRSERTMDRRIRIGREPNRTLIWDATTMLNFEPAWLTRAIDALPLIETDVMSRIELEAEIAQSLPNPNTSGVALVDDFEGVKNATSFGVGRGRWTAAAVPVGRTAGERARMLWFNPFRRISSRDIWPEKETDIKSSGVNVLSLYFDPNQPNPWPAGAYTWNTINLAQRWNGVQQAVSAGAADLNQLTYLELWVRGDRGELHIDMGTISEDTDNNGDLNTEDILRNGVRNGVIDSGEDVGLDGLTDEEELSFYLIHAGDNPALYPTVEGKQTRFTELYSDPLWYPFRSASDPSYDNWRYTNPDNYVRVNGSEGNRLDPDKQSKPDTEDINRNGYLDRSNNYTSWVIDLGPDSPDSAYVAGGNVDPTTWHETDSWRLYRIPLADAAGTTGTPDLSLVESIRVWLTAPPDTSAFEISLAAIDVVGNLWREKPIQVDETTLPPETVRASVRNTFDNAGEYIPPPGVSGVRDRITSLLSKEQSLAVTFEQLPAGVEGEVFRSIIKAEDFTLYRGLEMFFYGKPAAGWIANEDTSHLMAFLRFGADENNFYEFRTLIHPGWDDRNHVVVNFNDIATLKETMLADWGAQTGIPDTTEGQYRVRGRPSLTNIKRLSVGVMNLHPSLPIDGEIWADELRVTEVRRDTGTASRLGFRMQLADFSTIDFRISRRTADFHGLREKRGSLSTTQVTNLQWITSLDQLMPAGWGFDIPLTINNRSNLSLPKYLPGSDLILEEGQQFDYRTEQQDQSISISIQKRNASENPLVAWTIDRMVINMTSSRREGTSPINPVNESHRVQGRFSYDLNPRRELEWYPLRKVPLIPASLKETAFNPLPTILNYALNATRLDERVADHTGQVRSRDAFTATEQFNVGFHPFQPLTSTYTLSLDRDLTQGWALSDANLGREVHRNQLFNANYDPATFAWMTQSYQYRVEYRENNDPRFNTRITPEGEQVRLGRSANTNVEGTATYTIIPTRLIGPPRPLEDATGLPKLINDIKTIVTRVTPMLVTLSSDRVGNQYNLMGRPSVAYQLGLREQPDVPRAAVVATQQASIQSTRTINANTGLNLPLSAFVDFRPQWRWIDQISESKTTFATSVTWPAVSLRWQGLQQLWFFPDITSSISVSSSYQHTRDTTDWLRTAIGEDAVREPYSTNDSKALRPLIGIQILFLNGITISTGRNALESVREQLTGGTSQTRSRNSDNHIDVSYRFSAPEGIKLPFIKKPLRITSTVDARVRLERRQDTTEVRIGTGKGAQFVPTVSTATWSVRPRLGYSFSQMIEGGIDMRFEAVEDRLMDRTRNVREVAIYMNLIFR